MQNTFRVTNSEPSIMPIKQVRERRWILIGSMVNSHENAH